MMHLQEKSRRAEIESGVGGLRQENRNSLPISNVKKSKLVKNCGSLGANRQIRISNAAKPRWQSRVGFSSYK
jgi:hypothetical protein